MCCVTQMNDFSYVPSDTYFSKNVDKNIIQLDCVPFCKGSSIIIIIYANDNFYRKREGGGWKMMINIITIYSDGYMHYDLLQEK